MLWPLLQQPMPAAAVFAAIYCTFIGSGSGSNGVDVRNIQ